MMNANDIEEMQEFFRKKERDARMARDSFTFVNDIEKVNYYNGKLDAFELINAFLLEL